MSTKHSIPVYQALLFSVAICTAWPAAAASNTGTLGLSVRQHTDHSVFLVLPHGEDDISYGLCYDLHDSGGFWRLGVDYLDSPSGTNGVDSVITPHLSLVFEDDFWRGGAGLLYSFVEVSDGESDSIDFYWQLLLGISIPLGTWNLEVYAYYVFEDWDVIDQIDSGDLDFGAVLKIDL